MSVSEGKEAKAVVKKNRTEYSKVNTTHEQRQLLRLLSVVLTGEGNLALEKNTDWEALCLLAGRHGVLPLLYEVMEANPTLPPMQHEEIVRAARIAVKQSYRILFLCKYLVNHMEEAGIPVAVLKGVGTSSFYPVPEIRKTGDVDLLLLDRDRLEQAKHVMARCGCKKAKEQISLHHVVYEAPEGIEVELHTLLAEPFDNHKVNQYLERRVEDCRHNVVRADCMGVTLPILDTGYHAYELLMHMLQHFLYSGFGLRLICDWVVFWSREVSLEEKEKYLTLVKESGVKGFSDMVTLICCTYLGLDRKKIEWMGIVGEYDVKSFLRDIMEGEEFGKSTEDRMVMMRGASVWDYLREFHHQTYLNFPRGSRHALLWPALWALTLVRFLRNNRKIRHVSAFSVMKKAGQRSRIMEQIKLWKE